MIDQRQITACLNTKDDIYPPEVLRHTAFFFREILVSTRSDSPWRKYALFDKVQTEYIYYSDDDAICPSKNSLKKHSQV